MQHRDLKFDDISLKVEGWFVVEERVRKNYFWKFKRKVKRLPVPVGEGIRTQASAVHTHVKKSVIILARVAFIALSALEGRVG